MANSDILRVAATLALGFVCGSAHAIYKCTDAKGNTTYQQTPCESSAAQTSIGPEKKPPPAAQRATAAAAPAGAARPPGVATVMTSVVRCGELSPGFVERIQPTYGRWSEANNENLQSFQRTPEYARLLQEARKERAASAGKMSPDLAAECRKTEEYFAQNWGTPQK